MEYATFPVYIVIVILINVESNDRQSQYVEFKSWYCHRMQET